MPGGLAVVLVSLASACAGGHTQAVPVSTGATATHSPHLTAGTLVIEDHAASGPVATDPRHLVWESGPIESDQFQPSLHERDLASGTTKTIASNVNSLFGLASTTHFVFYAQSSASSTSVVRISHGGTDRHVLTDALVTPIASRGNVVAWGEQTGATQRVVAYTGGKRSIVAQMSRCGTTGCYRLDTVTVAKDGIVFTRDAVGAETSQVVRRAFGASKAETLSIPNDPQPNLVPSSSGALYYVLSRGWYRWDFGSAHPAPVSFANHPLKQLIRHEGSHWYWLVRHGCSVRLESTTGGKAAALAVPPQMAHVAPDLGQACTQLGALTWAGGYAIASWAIASNKAEETHNDAGLHGVVVSARVAAK